MPITRGMWDNSRMNMNIRTIFWFGAVVYQSHRQPFKQIKPCSSNGAFGQASARASGCWVVVNGKNIKVMLDSWEFLVAMLVVLTFFITLSGVRGSQTSNALLHKIPADKQASFHGLNIKMIDAMATRHWEPSVACNDAMDSSMPSHHGAMETPQTVEAVCCGSSVSVALEIARSQWLEHSTAVWSHVIFPPLDNTNGNGLRSGANPLFSRLS